MQRRIAVILITLAILAPGVVAGTVVASYFIHHKFTAPPITTVQARHDAIAVNVYRYRGLRAEGSLYYSTQVSTSAPQL